MSRLRIFTRPDAAEPKPKVVLVAAPPAQPPELPEVATAAPPPPEPEPRRVERAYGRDGAPGH